MTTIVKAKRAFCRLKTLIYNSQRSTHTVAGRGGESARMDGESSLDSVSKTSSMDISKWKNLDSRIFGIKSSMISSSSWIVLKILQNKGFEAYLVGGCVRDLLLKRIPKDFDIVTTAELRQVRRQFHHAIIVGRRFPICRVHLKSSIVEVSSFKNRVAKLSLDKEADSFSEMVIGCDKKDLVRWRDCMNRDFTINSLLYDPFVNKIYDYTDGMTDLCSFKLQTVIPAQMSFTEDCARILRGIRIAARLGLSISKETKEAMKKRSSSIKSLNMSRLMAEMNFMLSYGAAKSSIHLLKRFNLLQILLPFHAAYLVQQANNHLAPTSIMLMKLFSSMDKLLACDRPSHCSLWIGLLAFHLALVNNPQDTLVVCAFFSVLYHGNWSEAVKFSRENAPVHVRFVPEISEASGAKSDEALAEAVTRFILLVKSSIGALTKTECLVKSMSRYPGFPCSGLVLVSKRMAKDVAKIFNVSATNITSYKERKSFEIDYKLLGEGDQDEVRFVLGKIIMDTMSVGTATEYAWHLAANEEGKHCVPVVNLDGKREAFKRKKCHPVVSIPDPQVVLHEEQQHSQEVDKNEEQFSLLSNLKQCLRQAMLRCLPPSKHEQQQKKVKNNKKVADKECNKLQTEMAKTKRKRVDERKCDLKQQIAKTQKAEENSPRQQMAKRQQKIVEKESHHQTRQETAQKQPTVVKKDKSKRKKGTTGKIQLLGENESQVLQKGTAKQQKEVEELTEPKQKVVTRTKQGKKLAEVADGSHAALSSLFK